MRGDWETNRNKCLPVSRIKSKFCGLWTSWQGNEKTEKRGYIRCSDAHDAGIAGIIALPCPMRSCGEHLEWTYLVGDRSGCGGSFLYSGLVPVLGPYGVHDLGHACNALRVCRRASEDGDVYWAGILGLGRCQSEGKECEGEKGKHD